MAAASLSRTVLPTVRSVGTGTCRREAVAAALPPVAERVTAGLPPVGEKLVRLVRLVRPVRRLLTGGKVTDLVRSNLRTISRNQFLESVTCEFSNASLVDVESDGDANAFVLTIDDDYHEMLMKCSASGELLWSLPLPTERNSSGMTVAPDGTIFVVGNLTSACFIAKLTEDGDEMWMHTFGASAAGGCGLSRVVDDSDGNIYAAGTMAGEPFIAKYSSEGNELWSNRNASIKSISQWLAVTADGNSVIGGPSLNESVHGILQPVLVRFESGWQHALAYAVERCGNWIRRLVRRPRSTGNCGGRGPFSPSFSSDRTTPITRPSCARTY